MSSWDAEKQRIAGYYQNLLDQHGETPRACDYGRPESQAAKFRVLSEVVPLQRQTLLDVGCGFAHFADYLSANAPNVRYSGVDITPAFVEAAQKSHPGLDLQVLDILGEDPGGPFDIVTANGIFYLICDNPEQTMQDLVVRMFGLCTEALAFNSLSAWCPDKEDGEFYADPLRTMEFCHKLTPWISMRHDYHSRDFTIYLYRNRQP